MPQAFIRFFHVSMLVFITGLLAWSCTEDDPTDQDVDFDRKAMLTHWADNIILPAYQDFESKVDAFHKSVDQLAKSDAAADLKVSQELFEEVYLSFQSAKIYQVGPAANLALRSTINTFPADTQKVLSNIARSDFDFGSASKIDAQGLPALEFMLFGKRQQVLADSLSQRFLQAAADHMHHQVRQVLEAWNSGYREEFINATGTDIGSSLGQMVNALNKDFEVAKNAKIGFPAGKRSMGQPYPYTAEAPYSGLSLKLVIRNIEAIKALYEGEGLKNQATGVSLKDYVYQMQRSNPGETPLDEDISVTLQEAITALENIPQPFTEAVYSNKPAVNAAYDKLVDGVILLKSEMPSTLGVLITYQDNDGD